MENLIDRLEAVDLTLLLDLTETTELLWPMYLGAALLGMLTAMWLSRWLRPRLLRTLVWSIGFGLVLAPVPFTISNAPETGQLPLMWQDMFSPEGALATLKANIAATEHAPALAAAAIGLLFQESDQVIIAAQSMTGVSLAVLMFLLLLHLAARLVSRALAPEGDEPVWQARRRQMA
jgi:hypothetical protein